MSPQRDNILDQVFNESPSFIALTVGATHTFERANRRYYETFNLDSTILGKTVQQVIPGIESQGFVSLLDQVFKTGKAYRENGASVTLKSVNGVERTVFLDFAYQPLRNAEGEVYGIIHQGYEVTEIVQARKLLERSKEVVENERRNFQELFRQTPEMVCITRGPDHVFEFVNEAHIRALGFDATAQAVREAQPESVEVHGILDEVYRTGKTAELHEIPVTLTDRLRYFNLTYAARRNELGAVNGIMVLGVEVTDQILARENLRESQSRLKFALANANMGSWTVTFGSNEVDLSDESTLIFGLSDTVSRDVEQTILAVIHPEDRAMAAQDLQNAIASHTLYQSEYRIIRPVDGVERWIFASGRAQYDQSNHPISLSGIIMDITHRKSSEEKLKRALKIRDEFLSIASHELKTPVTSLKLQLQMANRKVDSSNNTVPPAIRLAKVFETSIKQVDRLENLIDDLLDVSRIEVGKMNYNFELTDLRQLISEVVERFQGPLSAPSVEISVSLPTHAVEVQCDRFRIEQVITNLMSNAIKYGDGKSIRVMVKEGAKGEALFSVQDHGLGIAPEKLLKIFDRYERAVNYTNISGLGLGLYISREIVNAHQGTIEVESDLGKGTTFSVSLPKEQCI